LKFVKITFHWRSTSVHFSNQYPRTLPTIAGGRAGGLDHPTPPARPPAMFDPVYTDGWSVGQSAVSDFPCYSGAQIHLRG